MKSNNLQVIYVMWLREMKRFIRSSSRVAGTIAMPFFFLLAMGFGFGPSFMLANGGGGVNYINFLVPGIIAMTMLFNSMFSGLSVLWDKEFGFLKEILVAPVKRPVIILGRIAGGITTALIQAFLILLISLFFGFKIVNPVGILLAVVFMILIGVGFTGFGVALASVMDDVQGFPLITQLITFPLFLLSGALFPVNNFPAWLKPFTLMNPLAYGVDGLRGALIGYSQIPFSLAFSVCLIFALAMVGLGAWLFNKTEA